MSKLTKNKKLALEKIEDGRAYTIEEAAQLVKEITFTKFDASVDIDVRLGVDPRKANQMVRGVVTLPMEPVKISEYWYFVPLIRLKKPKLPVPTMLDWMSILKN